MSGSFRLEGVLCAALVGLGLAACPDEPGVDAGVRDAGAVTDAGTTVDAGARVDAGTPVDAGTVVDAGPIVDAGTPVDASTPPTDAGVPRADGGEPPSDDSGPSADDGGVAGTDAGGTDAGYDGGTPFPIVAGDAGVVSFDAAPTALELERVRGFECDAAAVGSELSISDVDGDPGARVAIRPGGGACVFSLHHMSAVDVVTDLSTTPRGYLFAAAARAADGVTAVCASAIAHTPTASPGIFTSDAVSIECWALLQDGTVWASEVVTGDAEYAAWVVSLTASTESGRFDIRWIRDFSFQFLNLSDNGRPASDGLYETQLFVEGAGLRADPAVQLSSSTLEPAEPAERWIPTADEVALLGEHMDLPEPPPASADGGPDADAG